MDRYDTEIEARDTEIQLLKEKREEQVIRIEELLEIYEQRLAEVNAYMAVKEKRRLAEEYKMKRLRACIRIQAWWRGEMVRKCLGPFKKPPPGGKKKK
ncbi:hypothetical protein RI129_005596 [Pyrocoelia pectoralis]|uniref:Dynein regulatory complex protein 9 n=1 Tax=Pyrocoelia pectoralis TaxID=417401 RepID=A0AAN7ZKN5_9COLE